MKAKKIRKDVRKGVVQKGSYIKGTYNIARKALVVYSE